MTCYHPIQAWLDYKCINPDTGKPTVRFDNKFIAPSPFLQPIQLPCGRCVGCRLERSRQWAMRCVHEASLHPDNCFLTLTYSDSNLPSDLSLVKRDLQLFLKRLRKKYTGVTIRFFGCGEYGSQNLRPHYHCIIFGMDFPDKILWSTREGVNLFRSPTLEKLWPFGFSTIGSVNFESCAYVARYVLKKVTGPNSEHHYNGRIPEFVQMSRRPGIGRDWLLKFKNDVYNNDYVVIKNGIKCKPPRYYDNIFDTLDHKAFLDVSNARKDAIAKLDPVTDYNRLDVRERCKNKQLDLLPRKL